MASVLLETWSLSKEPQEMPLDRCDPETPGLRGLDLDHCERLAKSLVESPVIYQGDPWIVVQNSDNENCMLICVKHIVCTKRLGKLRFVNGQHRCFILKNAAKYEGMEQKLRVQPYHPRGFILRHNTPQWVLTILCSCMSWLFQLAINGLI